MQKILSKLPNKTSAGTDNIPSIVLKNLPNKIIAELTIIVNNAINISYFPANWKTAIIVPKVKKGKNSNNPASDRPISLTTSLSKVYEIVINKAIMKHVNNNKLLSDNQFGFRQGHSTIHAIHKLISDVNHHLYKRQVVAATLIDLEKAFDTVWSDGLMFKLLRMNFPIKLLYLIYDMVHDKKFHVKHDKLISETRVIQEGLQQ